MIEEGETECEVFLVLSQKQEIDKDQIVQFNVFWWCFFIFLEGEEVGEEEAEENNCLSLNKINAL